MAKQRKAGLGRGLNSLLGGYEAPVETQPVQTQEVVSEKKPAPQVTPSVQREVIREEDLSQEDREALDGEKHVGGNTAQAAAPVSHTAVQSVVAKQEFIEDNDGVTIKGVRERSVTPAAKYMDEPQKPSAIDARVAQVTAAPVPAQAAAVLPQTQEAAPAKDNEDLGEVPIDLVAPNPNQPRKHFNKEELEELSASIAKDGLLQPILVREVASGYEIIAGERRWQACKLAGLKKVPIRIKEADDMKVLELALIENLQRSDLNPIEEAYGYKRIMERGKRTQSEVAAAVSKGRSTIANALRLLDLPEDAQQLLYEEKITAGHARAILSISSEEGRKKLTEKLQTEKISVREAEAMARLIAGREKQKENPVKRPATPKFFKKAAKSLTNSFGTKVKIRSVGGKNKIEIEFKDEDDLKRIYELMNHSE